VTAGVTARAVPASATRATVEILDWFFMVEGGRDGLMGGWMDEWVDGGEREEMVDGTRRGEKKERGKKRGEMVAYEGREGRNGGLGGRNTKTVGCRRRYDNNNNNSDRPFLAGSK